MRAAKKNFILIIGALFLCLAFAVPKAHAQTFGGSTSSSLFGASNASVFQAPGGTQQGGVSAQGSNADVLQTTGVKVLTVTGAPPTSTQSDSSNEIDNSNEVILLSILAGVFALSALYLLMVQIKKSY